MALGQIYTRSTYNSISNTLLGHLAQTSNDLFRVQQQLSTGRRILTPSMDALGATNWLSYQSRESRNSTYQSTVQDLTTGYNFVDAQLGEGISVLNSLKTIALRESNDGGSDDDTRSLSATEVNGLRETLLSLANSRYKNQSVFGGQNTTQEAFSTFGDAVKFNGTQNANTRLIDDHMAFETSLTAEQVFGDLQTTSAARRDLNPSLQLSIGSTPGHALASTPLSSLNGGRGVDTGVMSIVVYPEGPANPSSQLVYDVDLRGARTMADVVEAINNTRGRDGQPVFDATVYSGAGLDFPADGSNRLTGLRITATGEASAAINGKPSTIQFVDKPGRSTAKDLGLMAGELSYQFTSSSFTPPAAAPLNFDLNVNGVGMAISVTPAGGTMADLATALQDAIDTQLGVNRLFDFDVTISASDSDGDTVDDVLVFDVADKSGTGSIELRATNVDAIAVSDAIDNASRTSELSFNQAAGAFSAGTFGGRDLNPTLQVGTPLAALNGGNGLTQARLADGSLVQPQGLRITNGALSEDIQVGDLLANPNATLGDLINRINGSGVQVEARMAASGDRIEVVSKLVGVPLKVENLNGSLATQLGLDTSFNEMRIQDLNGGRGLTMEAGADFKATSATGISVEFDLGAAKDVAGIVNAINSDTANRQPDGTLLFEARAVTERSFNSGNVTGLLANPAMSMEVSLNGKAPRALNLTGPFATLDDLASAVESGINAMATQLGLTDVQARVHADNASGSLSFQIQDESGPASIDFAGGFTGLFGLDGTQNGQGVRSLTGETVTQRFTMTDRTFNSSTWVPGEPTPVLQNLGVSSVLEDLGISRSDAQRIQIVGSNAAASFDSTLAVALTLDLPRGPQVSVNLAAEGGRNLAQLAAQVRDAMNTQIRAAGIEGYAIDVRQDPNGDGLIVETTDGFGDGSLTIGGADAASLGLDAGSVTPGVPTTVAFNFATASYEGSNHELHGRASDNIFTTMNDLIRGLQSNSVTSIASTLGALEDSLTRTLDARGLAGTRVRRLELANNRLDIENQQLATLSSDVMDTDLAKAATEMARKEALFQASINATSRILKASVLDFI